MSIPPYLPYDHDSALGEVSAAQSSEELEAVRLKYLGRKGVIPTNLRIYAERRKQERALLEVIDRIERAWEERYEELT